MHVIESRRPRSAVQPSREAPTTGSENERAADGAPATRPVSVGAHTRRMSATPRSIAGTPASAVRIAGALSLLAVGAVHLQQFVTAYSAIPTIGTLFVLNFAGATVLGLGLLAPLARLSGRWGRALPALLAGGGIVLSASAFAFLLISERTPLFGFKEPGYDASAIMAARVSEVAAVVLLSAFLAAPLAKRAPRGRR
jgi:hypothetical protein